MNTRRKGRRKELKVRDLLIAQGYSVQLAPTPTKWSLQNDLFGLWDILACNTDGMRAIQVKTRLGDVKKEWREKVKAWQCPPNCTREIWVLADRKEPRIIVL